MPISSERNQDTLCEMQQCHFFKTKQELLQGSFQKPNHNLQIKRRLWRHRKRHCIVS